MADLVKANPQSEDFIWAADIQEHEESVLYVDHFHYSAQMSRLLAGFIADQLSKKGILSALSATL